MRHNYPAHTRVVPSIEVQACLSPSAGSGYTSPDRWPSQRRGHFRAGSTEGSLGYWTMEKFWKSCGFQRYIGGKSSSLGSLILVCGAQGQNHSWSCNPLWWDWLGLCLSFCHQFKCDVSGLSETATKVITTTMKKKSLRRSNVLLGKCQNVRFWVLQESFQLWFIWTYGLKMGQLFF